jgi:hypothetical protein
MSPEAVPGTLYQGQSTYFASGIGRRSTTSQTRGELGIFSGKHKLTCQPPYLSRTKVRSQGFFGSQFFAPGFGCDQQSRSLD